LAQNNPARQVTEWRPYAELYPGDQHTAVGKVLVLPQVYSPQLENARDIIVYLPPSYSSGGQRYPVVYLQDAQNLFDAATSFAGVEWQVDETLEALSGEGLEAIAVGIPHMGEQRLHEYTPPTNPWWRGLGDRYVAFIVETLKPLIDQTLRTQPERIHTGLFGSSLGALISLYGFFDRPDIFGRCGAMSPSVWVGRGVIQQQVRAPQTGDRLYLDNGTRENSARVLHEQLLAQGYREDKELKYVVEEGGQHTEAAWARRLPEALRFLLR
jgi:predicted alpha/beta superfamily hydrolase